MLPDRPALLTAAGLALWSWGAAAQQAPVPPAGGRQPASPWYEGEAYKTGKQTNGAADMLGAAGGFQDRHATVRGNRALDRAGATFKDATKAYNRVLKDPAAAAEELEAAAALKDTARAGLRDARRGARALGEVADKGSAVARGVGGVPGVIGKGLTLMEAGGKAVDGDLEGAKVDLGWEAGKEAVAQVMTRVIPGPAGPALAGSWMFGTAVGDVVSNIPLPQSEPGDPKNVGEWAVDRAVGWTHPDPTDEDYERAYAEARQRIQAQRRANEAAARTRTQAQAQAAAAYAAPEYDPGPSGADVLGQVLDGVAQGLAVQRLAAPPRAHLDPTPTDAARSGPASRSTHNDSIPARGGGRSGGSSGPTAAPPRPGACVPACACPRPGANVVC